MEPTRHTVYSFIPPYGAALVLHTNNIAELRFERARAADVLKWFEERTTEFRSQLAFHIQGPVMLGETPPPLPPTAIAAVGTALAPAQVSQPTQGKTLPLGTLLSRDQVQQLMQRFPGSKLEGEQLYKACVELGFVKQDIGGQHSAIGQNANEEQQKVESLPIEVPIGFNLASTSKVDLKAESDRIFQEAVAAAVEKALLAREDNNRDTIPVQSAIGHQASGISQNEMVLEPVVEVLLNDPRTVE